MNPWKASGILLNRLEAGRIIPLELGGKKLAVVVLQDQICTVSAICPHASGDLCQGWLDARSHLVCPVHFYRFDPRNGRNTSGEEYKLRTYPCEVRSGELYVKIE